MTRTFQPVDDEATLNLTGSLREALPPNHVARCVADVIAPLDLSRLSARQGTRGGDPFAPELRRGRRFSGYATGVFSARRIEKATHEARPFRVLAGDLPPDHDTLAHVRKLCLPAVNDLFVPIVLGAHAADGLQVGHISLDGTTLHADASNRHAVSDQRLLALEHQWRAEVDEWGALGAQAAQVSLPAGLSLADELARRQARLAHGAQAHAVVEARAQERYQAERTAQEAQLRARAEKARTRKPRGPQPPPPPPGPRDRDPSHFTDPASRLRQNSHNDGFDPPDHAHIAPHQHRLLGVAHALSNPANDQAAVEPTLEALPEVVGTPPAGALATGSFSAAHMTAWEQRGFEPSIAGGREPHHQHGSASGAPPLAPPPEEARPLIQMADKLRTAIGQAMQRWRTGPVEPVIGLINAVRGFRPFSLRGLTAAAGAWGLGCLAGHLKRLPVLLADCARLPLAWTQKNQRCTARNRPS